MKRLYKRTHVSLSLSLSMSWEGKLVTLWWKKEQKVLQLSEK